MHFIDWKPVGKMNETYHTHRRVIEISYLLFKGRLLKVEWNAACDACVSKGSNLLA